MLFSSEADVCKWRHCQNKYSGTTMSHSDRYGSKAGIKSKLKRVSSI